jgi:hypothetical protein
VSLPIRPLTSLQRAVFLLNSRLSLFTAALIRFYAPQAVRWMKAPLLPKLRGQFAEFLNRESLERLRILSSPTCVGLRYGHPQAIYDAFLGSRLGATMGSPEGSPYCRASAFTGGGFAYPPAYTLQRAIPSARGPYASASRLRLRSANAPAP